MIFLNGILLSLLATAGIPLLIHLLNPRRRPPQALSTTRFLKAIEATHLRRLRITRLLLLLLRMAIVILLVLSFARPAHRWQGLVGGRQALHAVLLVDNSLSSRRSPLDRPLLQQHKERCQALLDNAREQDRFTLISIAAPARMLGSGAMNAAQTREQLRRLASTESADDLTAALALAKSRLAQEELIQEVHLFSDQGLAIPRDSLQLEWPEELFCWLHLQEDAPREPGFLAPRAELGLLRSGKTLRWPLVLRDWPPADELEAKPSLQLRHLEQVWYSRPLDRAEQNVELRFPAPAAGDWPLVLSLQGGVAQPPWRKVLRVPASVRVLLVNDSAQTAIAAALAPDSSYSATLQLKQVKLTEFSSLRLEDWDVLVLAQADRFPSRYFPALQQAMAQGLGLLMLPGKNAELRELNTLLKQLELPVAAAVRQGGNWRITRLDQQHPVFEGLLRPGEELRGPEIRRYLKLTAQGLSGRTLLGLAEDDPLLKSWEFSDSRVLFLSTTVDPEWSDLVYSGIFAPMLQGAVRWLALGQQSSDTPLVCGRESQVTFQPQSGILPELEGPQGTIVLQAPTRNGILRIPPLSSSGFYQLRGDRRGTRSLAINADHDDLARQFAGLANLSQRSGLEWQEADRDPQDLAASRRGSELWRGFLIAALLLLLLEQFLSMRTTSTEQGLKS